MMRMLSISVKIPILKRVFKTRTPLGYIKLSIFAVAGFTYWAIVGDVMRSPPIRSPAETIKIFTGIFYKL
jgi:hypothetical protein